jgi:hypothetical protein
MPGPPSAGFTWAAVATKRARFLVGGQPPISSVPLTLSFILKLRESPGKLNYVSG